MDEFIASARRAMRRAARKVREENRKLGLPVIAVKNRKLSKRTKSKPRKTPAFVVRAERALRRAARNVKAQNRALKLPVIVWKDGKLVNEWHDRRRIGVEKKGK